RRKNQTGGPRGLERRKPRGLRNPGRSPSLPLRNPVEPMTEPTTLEPAGTLAAPPEETPIVVPDAVNVNEFQRKSLASLHEAAQELGLRVAGVRSKHQLVFEILRFYGTHGTAMEAEGFLDWSGEPFGFLRWPEFSFASSADDVSITAA